MIHPLQYELENAHHVDCQRRAAQERLVAEAEQLAASDTPSAPLLRTITACLRWPVIHAPLVRVHERLTRGAARWLRRPKLTWASFSASLAKF